MLPNMPKILHDAQPILHASERWTQVFKNVPLVSYRQARNLGDMLCSKPIIPPEYSNPNPAAVHQTNSGNLPANTNRCPECSLKLKNQKGLKIHQSSKHQWKQNVPTSPAFWPYLSDTRCDTCRQGLFFHLGYQHQQRQNPQYQAACYLQNEKCVLLDQLQQM